MDEMKLILKGGRIKYLFGKHPLEVDEDGWVDIYSLVHMSGGPMGLRLSPRGRIS